VGRRGNVDATIIVDKVGAWGHAGPRRWGGCRRWWLLGKAKEVDDGVVGTWRAVITVDACS
jgi:hypothetical protein